MKICLYYAVQRGRLLLRKYPVNFTFFVTYRCNLKCPFCFLETSSSSTNDQLDLTSIQQLAASLKGIIKNLAITGGEPFLRADIIDLCQAFVAKADLPSLVMVTNGWFTERIEDFCAHFSKHKNLSLSFQLSLDGPKQYHDSIRGEGSFDRLINTAKLLAKFKKTNGNLKNITAVSMLTRDSAPYLKETVEIVKSFGFIHEFNLVRGVEYSADIKNSDLRGKFNPKTDRYYLKPAEMDALVKKLLKLLDNDELAVTEKLLRKKFDYILKYYNSGKTGLKCTAGRNEVVIMPNGDVSVCEMYKPFGNLKECCYDFREFWHHAKPVSVLKAVDRCSCAHDCSVINSMPYNFKALKQFFR